LGLRVSVTGGGGFLGTYLLRLLRKERRDAQLVAVVRRLPAEPVQDVDYRVQAPACDLLFHLAGSGGIAESLADPWRDLQAHAGDALAVLEAARGMPGVRVVLASSAAVYGQIDGVISEDQAPRPVSPYGVSKLAAEGYARAYAERYGLDVRIARIGNPYGPGQRRLAVYDLACRALREPPPLRIRGTGAEVRDFVHASDVARALAAIADRGAPGETYNVASGRAVTLREVAELVGRAAGLPPAAVQPDGVAAPGSVGVFRPSIARLAGLGFGAGVPLDRGIEETVAWVRRA
jgi:UDP-glucose 4-epimerase